MQNLRHLDDVAVFDIIKEKCSASISIQYFAACDIILTFRYFRSFRLRDVKYELLGIYPERILKKAIKQLHIFGVVTKNGRDYSVEILDDF